ncbi:hypothetical protein CSOJ01_08845 [Colletotrichum sojae]|uniref:Uncharacterized protein n=1 Tax=Colletotrichum sojae TaxID=2175907 RepID=A0A8H6J4I8_9PEZI|nr:hypothetical protein CSOJ01_08845 [Colletotrichum sojae]
MKFSVVFAIFTTVAMAANIPGFEGEGLEKRQRSCTIGAAVRAPLVKSLAMNLETFNAIRAFDLISAACAGNQKTSTGRFRVV